MYKVKKVFPTTCMFVIRDFTHHPMPKGMGTKEAQLMNSITNDVSEEKGIMKQVTKNQVTIRQTITTKPHTDTH